MHFTLSSALLAGALLSLSLPTYALPTDPRAGLITLPLNKVHQPRDDIHPQIMHQLHLNRAHKRLARMTRATDSFTTEQAAEALHKRLAKLGLDADEFVRRYNRPHSHPAGGKRDADADPTQVADPGPTEVADSGSGPTDDLGPTEVVEFAAKATVTVTVTLTSSPAPGPTDPAAVVADSNPAQTSDVGQLIPTDAPATTDPAQTDAAAPPAATGVGGPAAEQAAQNGDIVVAGTPTGANSLGLQVEAGDVGYSATIQLGTPPQNFLLIMDSGSGDLWVGSENCTSLQGGDCGPHQFLGPKSSSTFVDSQQPWNIKYGTGSVQGTKVTDNLAVAGMALNGHSFGVAAQESVDFSASSVVFDGIMGLAQSTLSEQGVLTPIEAMKANGLVKQAITSYKLARSADATNDGEITFGGLDTSKFDATTLQTVPNVNPNGFWEASMPAITVNGKDTGLKGRTAILDTGTTLIIAPTADATAIHAAIPGSAAVGAGQFTVPCNTQATVALTFGKLAFEIQAKDLAFLPVANGSPDCQSGIGGADIGGAKQWLVGDVFLKNAYFSHDVDQNAISLAKLV